MHFPCLKGIKKLIRNFLQIIEYSVWPDAFLQFESGFSGQALFNASSFDSCAMLKRLYPRAASEAGAGNKNLCFSKSCCWDVTPSFALRLCTQACS